MMMAGLGFILAFVGVILLISSLVGIAKDRSFSACSQSVTGRVGNKYSHKANNHKSYSMDVLYTVDGNDYKRSVPIDADEYKKLQKGDLFEIKYKPDHPKRIIRADSLSEKNTKSLRTLLIVSAAMTVIGIALILMRIAMVSK